MRFENNILAQYSQQRSLFFLPQTLAQKRHQVSPGTQKGGYGIAGQGKNNSLFPEMTKPKRLARPLGHLVKTFFHTQFFQHFRYKVKLPCRNGPAQHHHIKTGQYLAQAFGDLKFIIGKMKQLAGNVKFFGQHGLKGIGVGTADLMRQRRFSEAYQLVAGRHDGYPGAPRHQKAGLANRGGSGNFGGGNLPACRHQQLSFPAVRTLKVKVLAKINILREELGLAIFQPEFFVSDDGVDAFRQHRAGHYLQAVGRIGQAQGRRSGSLDTRYRKPALAGSETLEPDRDAVHRNPVEGRKITVGVQRFAQDTAPGLQQRKLLRAPGPGMAGNDFFGFRDTCQHRIQLDPVNITPAWRVFIFLAMLHQKHSKLARAGFGAFGRREWAILGTSCGTIQQLSRQLAARLAPDVQTAYVDATHAQADTPPETPVFCLEYTDHLGFPQLNFRETPQRWQQHAWFNEADLVLLNGNHFAAARQILVLDRRKFDSVQRKTARLTQVDLFLTNSRDEHFAQPDELPDVLKEHLSDWAAIPILDLNDTEALSGFLRARLQPPPVKALILAGGKSTRMGQDKSALDYHGAPQWQHLKHILAQAGIGEPYLSCRSGQADAFAPEPVVVDSFLDLGPMGAILSAFREQPDVAWLVLACDLPLLDAGTIGYLLGQRQPSALATAFRQPGSAEGFPEPLVAIWEPRSYPVLLQFLAQGLSCPRKVLINNRTHLLDAPRPEALQNVNTPEERAEVLRQLHPNNAL